jgi:hypothetical protein
MTTIKTIIRQRISPSLQIQISVDSPIGSSLFSYVSPNCDILSSPAGSGSPRTRFIRLPWPAPPKQTPETMHSRRRKMKAYAGSIVLAALTLALIVPGCATQEEALPEAAPTEDIAPAVESSAPADLPNGLLLALAVLGKGPDGKPVPKPAQLGILTRAGGSWHYKAIEDPDSNVFHKAMVFEPAQGEAGILTFGGTGAFLKLWRPNQEPVVLWHKDFGGKFSRMRDGEVGDILGDGVPSVAVATHDQGVVAVVRPDGSGSWDVQELDEKPDTFVHEIELGDLNGDGALEIYATPSARNVLDGTPQPGEVVCYILGAQRAEIERKLVADLGDRHAKEILVADMDQDGVDELYVSVEAVSGGEVEIQRYDWDTDPTAGTVIATLPDALCRFLTVGDVDGDGHPEMIAATHKKGLYLLKASETGEWLVTLVDSDSSGFEHAAILTDLDEDGIDELYVASDKHGEVRRYVWDGGESHREVIFSHGEGLSGFTWNIMPAPLELLP